MIVAAHGPVVAGCWTLLDKDQAFFVVAIDRMWPLLVVEYPAWLWLPEAFVERNTIVQEALAVLHFIILFFIICEIIVKLIFSTLV
jgi:hypothetical protein